VWPSIESLLVLELGSSSCEWVQRTKALSLLALSTVSWSVLVALLPNKEPVVWVLELLPFKIGVTAF
jgi:hypothetical protein